MEERKAVEIVDAIIDWIDADDYVVGLGAESSYYASLPMSYAAKNAPLDCIEGIAYDKGYYI